MGPLPAPRLGLNATAYQGLQMLLRARRGALVVLDDSPGTGPRPVGIFTQRTVVDHLADGLFTTRELRRHGPIRDVMTTPPVMIRRNRSVAEGAEALVATVDQHLVVTDDDGVLRGLLTMPDIVQFVVDHFPEETLHLPPGLAQDFECPEGA